MGLSGTELDANMQSLAKRERHLLAQVLLTIREIDRRKLYLKLAYGSLFDYLTKHIGYSAGSAQRRIDAARLMGELPEVKMDIEEGALNLGHLSLVQRAVRQARIHGVKVPADKKAEILTELRGKAQKQSELAVARALDLPVLTNTHTKTQRDESVRIEITLSKTQYDKLERVKSLLSHSVPSGDLAQVIEFLTDKLIKSKCEIGRHGHPKSNRHSEPRQRSMANEAKASSKFAATERKDSKSENKDSRPEHAAPRPEHAAPRPEHAAPRPEHKAATATLEVEVPAPPAYITEWMKNSWRRSIPTKLRREITQRDQVCTHRDQTTGKICASTWQLELDHIQPVCAGGGNEPKNFRLLCRKHNVWRNSWPRR
jgi:hypothetical protein